MMAEVSPANTWLKTHTHTESGLHTHTHTDTHHPAELAVHTQIQASHTHTHTHINRLNPPPAHRSGDTRMSTQTLPLHEEPAGALYTSRMRVRALYT